MSAENKGPISRHGEQAVFGLGSEVHQSEQLVSPEVGRQITSFIKAHEVANSRREVVGRRRPEEYLSLLEYFKAYVGSHDARAAEISTPEYAAVADLAMSQFNLPVFGNDCMDGRNMSAMQHGFTASIFGSSRTAGGMNPEIVRDPSTQKKVLHEGQYSGILDRALTSAPDGTVIQLYDSHIGCAARKLKQINRKGGSAPEDDGLYADIVDKMLTSHAIESYAGDKGNKVISVFESFDPHTGFSYVGLDTKRAQDYAKSVANSPAYTDSVRQQLVGQGLIISTEALAHQPEVRAILNDHYFDVDYENQYVKTAKNFWDNIAVGAEEKPSLKDQLLPMLSDKLVTVYPELAEYESELLLQDRAMLLLTNLYSGYLHNTQITEDGTEFEAKNYPYGVHVEEGIDITEGSYGPYPGVAVFEISRHEPRPAGQTILASTIVRGNRVTIDETKRVVDKSGQISDPEEFAAASVPVTLTEIIRDVDTSDYGRILAQIDWSAMPQDWYMNSLYAPARFKNFLNEQVGEEVPGHLVIALESLRKRMITLDERMDDELTNHDVVVMPVIQDEQRRVLGVPQFILPGVGILQAA